MIDDRSGHSFPSVSDHSFRLPHKSRPFDVSTVLNSLVLTMGAFGYGWWTGMGPRGHFTPIGASGMSESGN